MAGARLADHPGSDQFAAQGDIGEELTLPAGRCGVLIGGTSLSEARGRVGTLKSARDSDLVLTDEFAADQCVVATAGEPD